MNSAPPRITPVVRAAVLTGAQTVVVALIAVAGIWSTDWLRATALLIAIGALGVSTALIADVQRMTQAQETTRQEVDALAAQPLTDLMVDVVRDRDIEQLRQRLPAVTDPGLALLVGNIAQSCSMALRMAVEHEDIRSGYTEVFVNMFRRTQTLLQRQLQVIERLEQDDRSAADMHLLFQLDHLVTRMRRHSENVLVLAGTELVRATKNPVSIADVFRAAMSEVETYQRIRVIGTPAVRISTAAAGDLIRIVAELLDNALSFSHPDREVTINAELARHHGLSIGVFDNGVGMSDEDIAKANDQLKNLGSVEIARSRRVGLVVVGRLAGRHGFTVEVFGGDHVEGVSVLISVPSAVLLEEETVRALLPRETRPSSEQVANDPAPSKVPVMTSVRRKSGSYEPEATGSRRMSSWHSRSKAWRAERDKSLAAARAGIGEEHANVPEELPVRQPGRTIPPVAAVPAEPPATTPDQQPDGRRISKWFQANDGTSGTAPEPEPAVVTPAATPNSYTYTEDGLPLRERGAHLSPRIADATTAHEDGPAEPIERDPASTRRRLSSYQSGVQKAKEAENRLRGKQHHPGGWTVLERESTK